MASQRPSIARSPNSGVSSLVLSSFLHELHRRTECEEFGLLFDGPSIRPGGKLPDRSCGAGEFAVRYLAGNILTKFDDGSPSPDKERSTWKRFQEAEDKCLAVNGKFESKHLWYSTSPRGVWSLIESATRKIAAILGPYSQLEALDRGGFGPGATTRLPRRRSHPVYKYSGKPDTTFANAARAMDCISSIPLWEQGISDERGTELNLVRGNRITTVPKNYKTDRTIAIEPDLNMFVQKGIGAVMRRRLKAAGIDLDDQSRNQRLALVGSLTGNLATIDLSMASDCVAYRLVEALLPSDWFSALEQCRSPEGVLPSGEWITYQKFSSMGNGYTFELETLIFFGLCLAVREAYGVEDTRVGVYGDDLVIPTPMAAPLIDLLSEVGFATNVEKSFVDGPFRESCGKHYFQGHDVTPFFVRRPVSQLSDLFLLHNNLKRWCARVGALSLSGESLTARLQGLAEFLRAYAPMNWRKPRIPDGIGDGAFIGTFDECTPTYRSNFPRKGRGWEGFMIPVLVEQSINGDYVGHSRLIYSLDQLERAGGSLQDVLSGPTKGRRHVVRKIYVQRFGT